MVCGRRASITAASRSPGQEICDGVCSSVWRCWYKYHRFSTTSSLHQLVMGCRDPGMVWIQPEMVKRGIIWRPHVLATNAAGVEVDIQLIGNFIDSINISVHYKSPFKPCMDFNL